MVTLKSAFMRILSIKFCFAKLDNSVQRCPYPYASRLLAYGALLAYGMAGKQFSANSYYWRRSRAAYHSAAVNPWGESTSTTDSPDCSSTYRPFLCAYVRTL